jgi:hypothetical protein
MSRLSSRCLIRVPLLILLMSRIFGIRVSTIAPMSRHSVTGTLSREGCGFGLLTSQATMMNRKRSMDRACFEDGPQIWIRRHDFTIVRFNPNLWTILETNPFLSLSRIPVLELGAGVEATTLGKK